MGATTDNKKFVLYINGVCVGDVDSFHFEEADFSDGEIPTLDTFRPTKEITMTGKFTFWQRIKMKLFFLKLFRKSL